VTRSMLPSETEAAFQAKVTNLAGFYQWRWYHSPDNRPVTAKSGRRYVQRVKAGFPDLVLVRGPELIFAELKTEKGRLSNEQRGWLAAIDEVDSALSYVVGVFKETGRVRMAGGFPSIEAVVWRPSDLERILERLARGRDVVRPTWMGPAPEERAA
jgi:hypothetical protein